MMTRFLALATVITIALPSLAEASALCGGKRGYGFSAPRQEMSIRVVREERVAPRPSVKAPAARPAVSTVLLAAAPVAAPVAARPQTVAAVAGLTGSEADAAR
jgi:hypothetical protein